MANLDLEAIENRWKAATEGPYDYDGIPYKGMDDPNIFSTTVKHPEGSVCAGELVWLASTVYDSQSTSQAHNVEGDTIFFAHAWQDIKDLLEETRRLRLLLDEANSR